MPTDQTTVEKIATRYAVGLKPGPQWLLLR